MNRFSTPIVLLISAVLLMACNRERQQPAFEFTMNNPTEAGTQYPHLYQDSTGAITMSWLLKIEEDLNSIRFSTYNEGRWTPPRTVLNSSDLFVNWADYPSVIAQNGEVVAAHWLKKRDGGPYAYDVNISFPGDEPRRWTDPLTPHDDGTATEHGFVSMEPLSGEKVLAVWLDGRNTADRGHDEYSDPSKGMTLRSAEISRDGTVEREREIDALVCDCCSTDLVLMEDRAAVVYRNRTEEEIRDISISYYDLVTGEWSDPEPVHNDGWEINGCPVNGPVIDHLDGRTAVAWYTEADGRKIVKTAVSDDGGQSFADPVVISDESPAGRTDVVVGEDGTVYTSWMNTTEDKGYVMLRSLSPEGSLGHSIRVGITTSNRRSGFPQMIETGNGLMFAWTQTDPLIRIRTARVSFDQLSELNTSPADS
ncbi:MAG: sialidase family protein [Balneolaceae bacterium]